ncbi:MAG: GntR family transcriptional regulator, partial [Betaproteobacteria bacterium]|nr:GntR family transcriptional regulator [Betaproteobacteria bacterium]
MVKHRPAPSRAHGAAALLPALRERIARHALPPGTKLLETDLAREFGVSRAKVRDAFGVLEQRGL